MRKENATTLKVIPESNGYKRFSVFILSFSTELKLLLS